jgi:lysophospholipase L1-like esterase
LWANPDLCQGGETPLDCEYRIHKPAYAIIMLGTNEALSPIRTFESNMRRIIETTIQKGIVPILTTKADNLEGNGAVNEVIVRLAREYDIPLWNFWAALQPLPGGGLQEDGAHLTYAGNRFDDPLAMQKAWPVRNLTALQTLDAIWHGTTSAQQ